MSLLDKKIHIMGIGGAGMSAIARLLHARGVRVTGDDRADSPALAELRALGIRVVIGHSPDNLGDADVLAPSSAISKDEPELLAAQQRGLPVWHRGDVLSALMQDKVSIAVAGAHGKTTTTGMIATLLVDAGLDPSFIIGGTPLPLGVNARAGDGDAFVLEADEYDRTFLHYQPQLAIVTNVEFDHPDIFKDLNDTLNTFAEFAASVPEDGIVVACADDAGCTEMLKRAQPKANVVTFGLNAGLWRATNVRSNALGGMDFSFSGAGVNGEVGGTCSLRVPGEHNVLNALAALVAADACGVPIADAAKALGGYRGAGRRFELKGEVRGIRIFDDYAHHPTEIKATLRGARLRYPVGNIWAIWQPHTYSRTVALLDGFVESFKDADHVIVLPIYAAREKKEDFDFAANALNPIEIARRMKHRDARNAASFGDALGVLMSQVRGGDVVITMSAGDGNQVGERLLQMLK
jgi:UDP-N-acetylmuramate--alanine ligase